MCCLDWSCLQLFWPRVVMRKWLNISAKESDYSADTSDEEDDWDPDSPTQPGPISLFNFLNHNPSLLVCMLKKLMINYLGSIISTVN